MTPTLQRNASPSQSTAPSLPDRDEFDSDAFEQQRQSLPYLQLLNHQDPDQSGFFITSENAAAVHFTPAPEWLSHTATFQNGLSVEGYRKTQYERSSMILKRRYLVFLISQDKRLLHSSPLLLTAKGAFCGSFGQTVEQFYQNMSKAYSAATGAKQPRGERFMALAILAVRLQPQLKGQAKQSWVCAVAEYGVPSVENWQAFFIGYRTELKQQVLVQYDEWVGFGRPEREFAAQRQESASAAGAPESQGQAENFEEFDYGYPEAI
jgi:hypothetical protein